MQKFTQESNGRILEIYVDENGERWFKTYGSSNDSDDTWYINEKYVVGIQDEGPVSKVALGVINAFSSSKGIIFIGVPLGIILLSLVFSFMKNIQIAKLELDCVEEKRKITDEICVKNNIGFNMSNQNKYKILAQATPEQRKDYLALLWKDGSTPEAIRKYVLRKYIVLKPMEKMLEVNRTCEKMFEDGKSPTSIAKYYLSEKSKIEEKQQRYKKLFKTLRAETKKRKQQAE